MQSGMKASGEYEAPHAEVVGVSGAVCMSAPGTISISDNTGWQRDKTQAGDSGGDHSGNPAGSDTGWDTNDD